MRFVSEMLWALNTIYLLNTFLNLYTGVEPTHETLLLLVTQCKFLNA